MSKLFFKSQNIWIMVFVIVFCVSATVYAEEPEDISVEQQSFVKSDGYVDESGEIDQYVDGIYNVGANARASMTGLIRLYQSGTKLASVYSTTYTVDVNKIGVKNIKLQYKGSLGIWHTIITLNDEYRNNASVFQGSFSCSGVIGRVYRVKGTHYIIDDVYSEYRDNVTGELTFR